MNFYFRTLIFTSFMSLFSCGKNEDNANTPVDPNDPNALSSVLVIPGSDLINGALPNPSGSPSAPTLEYNQPTLSTSSGIQFLIPFTFQSNSGYQFCYLQVQGATNGYFNIPNPNAASSPNNGSIAIPITIPTIVTNGEFCVLYCIQDRNGNISNIMSTCIFMKDQLDCSNAEATGYEGLTFTTVNMGNVSGTVIIDYNTYSLPDRIDVYQGVTWLGGTGSNPGSLIPPLSDCSNPLPGFIGTDGIERLNINYNPSNGRALSIVVSGCTGSGTLWDWQMQCP